jgi:hypothetical protein
MAKIANALLQGGTVLIENAGLSCFEVDQAGQSRLEFHLRAEQLALISCSCAGDIINRANIPSGNPLGQGAK